MRLSCTGRQPFFRISLRLYLLHSSWPGCTIRQARHSQRPSSGALPLLANPYRRIFQIYTTWPMLIVLAHSRTDTSVPVVKRLLPDQHYLNARFCVPLNITLLLRFIATQPKYCQIRCTFSCQPPMHSGCRHFQLSTLLQVGAGISEYPCL